jgi:putative protein kinase ArgK-like GTPase of G3E family
VWCVFIGVTGQCGVCLSVLLDSVVCVYRCHCTLWCVFIGVTGQCGVCFSVLLDSVVCVYRCYWKCGTLQVIFFLRTLTNNFLQN